VAELTGISSEEQTRLSENKGAAAVRGTSSAVPDMLYEDLGVAELTGITLEVQPTPSKDRGTAAISGTLSDMPSTPCEVLVVTGIENCLPAEARASLCAVVYKLFASRYVMNRVGCDSS